MLRRIAARAVTGPLAFLVAGLIDVVAFAVGSAAVRAASVLARRRA